MLKIIDYVEKDIEKIEIDYYIPFNIRFSNSLNPFIKLWRVINKNSLLEIAVDNKTGAIEYITLVNIEREKVTLTKESFHTNVEKINGVPICDLEIWSDKNILDHKSDLRLIIGSDFLRFSLVNDSVKRYYTVTRAYVGFNSKGEFCEVAINNLSGEEMDILKSCLHIEKNQ